MDEPKQREPASIVTRWEADEEAWDRAIDRAIAEGKASNEPPNGMTEEEIAEWRRQRGLPPEVTPRGTP